MAESNNKGGNNWGLFAIVFAAIYGILRGALKIGESIKSSNEKHNKEIEKMRNAIRDGLKSGLTDGQILQALYNNATNFFGRELTLAERNTINDIFTKERAKISDSEISSARQNNTISDGDEIKKKIIANYSKNIIPTIRSRRKCKNSWKK